jgi:chaperone required for assembly of F1-ATPase
MLFLKCQKKFKILQKTKKYFTLVQPSKLKKKFYKNVEVVEIENTETPSETKLDLLLYTLTTGSNLKDKYYQILLDGKRLKTIYQDEYKIPNKKLAYAIAEEWDRQKEMINLYSMHMVYNINNKEHLCKLWYKNSQRQ